MEKQLVAVVGLSCRFPGASDYRMFLDNLEHSVNSVTEIGKDRWDVDAYYTSNVNETNKMTAKWCGQLKNYEYFDNNFFHISAKEAAYMNPEHRLLLEETWKCIEDAGISPEHLRKTRTAVYVAQMENDYLKHMIAQDENMESYTIVGNYSAAASNRISYHFGLLGESFTIDAACATSLIALHKAKEALQAGTCDYAIVGGVNLNLHPLRFIASSKAHMFSPDGQCKTFDKSANGYVPGDGVGVILLQRVEDAKKSKKHIYGVIRGSAANHTGTGNSITAPSIEQQQQVIELAYQDAGINPETISYIEAHGTGTSLGDPIEVNGLSRVFRQYTEKKQFCKIGSVKTNIGHLETAAGIAGVIKVLGMMQRKEVFPTLNFNEPNPVIDFEESPFAVANQLSEWKTEPGQTLRAGISAFGIAGANAHVVIDSYEEEDATEDSKTEEGRKTFLLSAKTQDSLEKMKDQWLRYLESPEADDVSLTDICDNLMYGRESFPVRIGMEVGSKQELIEKLKNEPVVENKLKQQTFSIVIGDMECKGIQDVNATYLEHPVFKERLEEALSELEKLSGKKTIRLMYEKKTWAKAYVQAFRFITAFSIIGIFEWYGLKSACYSGEGIGALVALVQSGALDVKQVLSYLTGKKKAEELKIGQGTKCCYFESESCVPIRLTKEDIQEIVAKADISDQQYERLMKKASLLYESQFTFIRNMKEWNETLKQYGLDTDKIVRDGLKGKNIVYALIVSSAIKRLNKKWNFEETKDGNEAYERLVDFIIKEHFTKENICSIFLEKDIEYTEIVNLLNDRIRQNEEENLVSILSNAKNREGYAQEVKRVLQTYEDQGLAYSKQTKFLQIAFGKLKSEAKASSFYLESEILTATYQQLLLNLWKAGVDIQWTEGAKLYHYHKVSLPTYNFDSKRHLTKKVEQYLNSISRDKGAKQYSLSQKIVSDHVITGKTIVPAALMITDFGEQIAERMNSTQYSMKNVMVQRPCIVTDRSIVNLDIPVNEPKAVLREKDNILAQCRFEMTEEKEGTQTLLRKPETERTIDISNIYATLSGYGYQYGSSLQVMKKAWMDDTNFYVHLENEQVSEKNVSPELIDGAFQAMIACYLSQNGGWSAHSIYVPFLIKEIKVYHPLQDECIVQIEKSTLVANRDSILADLKIFTKDGTLAVKVNQAMLMKSADTFLQEKAASVKNKVRVYRPEWEETGHIEEISGFKGKQVVVTFEPKEEMEKMLPNVDILSLAEYLEEGTQTEYRFEQAKECFAEYCKKAFEEELQIIYVSHGYMQKQKDFDVAASVEMNTYGLFWIMKNLMEMHKTSNVRLAIIVSDSGKVLEEDLVSGYAKGALSGFAKTIAREFKTIPVKVIDCPSENWSLAEKEWKSKDSEEIVCYRQGKRFLSRVQNVEASTTECKTLLRENGVYLAAGGAGGIGRKVAEQMVNTEKCTVILLGRSALSEDRKKWLEKCNTSLGKVIYYPVDIADEEAMKRLLEHIKNEYGAVTGVFNMSGVLRDSILYGKKWEDFKQVLSPKVRGTWNLHELTKEEPLDFFCIFSSVVSVLGNMGQSDYASGNAFIDAFAQYRLANGFPGNTVSINWTLWSDGGMGRNDSALNQLGKLGIDGMDSDEGVQALWNCMGNGSGQYIVLANEFSKVQKAFGVPAGRKKKLIKKQSSDGEKQKIYSYLLENLSDVLGIGESEIAGDVEFTEYGIDSIGIMGFVDKIAERFGDDFQHATVMENPTLNQLSDYIVKHTQIATEEIYEEVDMEEEEVPEQNRTRAEEQSNGAVYHQKQVITGRDIAVVSVAGRFPQSPNIEAYWDNICQGKCLVREVPTYRFAIEPFFNPEKGVVGKTYSRWAGLMENVNCFDAAHFKIKEEDAIEMDPQQRLFLELTKELFERGGYTDKEVGNSRTSVIVGAHESNYARKLPGRSKYHGPHGVVNVISNMIPGQVMQHFNLKGTAEAIFCACSSSLVAIHKACNLLRDGECDMAIAGGIELLLDEEWFLGFSASKVLSPEGRCKVFDKDANGFVLGEGMGSVLLKRLEDAICDGDQILGVIKGSAVNNDGQTMGLTTPSLNAQKEVIQSALDSGGIDASTISMYEAHGTGTQLGDPIEVKAASQTFEKYTSEKQYCAIGSVKSNVGHMLSAAGIGSFIKVILALGAKKIPATINCNQIHPRYDFKESPFYPVMETKDWEGIDGLRRAAISSFGFGGTNCHMIVDEFIPEQYSYLPRRKPLPLTKFNRYYYQLGEEVCREYESVPAKVIEELKKGHITKETAKEYLHNWEDYTFTE